MRCMLLPIFLAALTAAAPTSEEFEHNKKFIFTPEYYDDAAVIYEGRHDIVDIFIPVNAASDIEKGKNLKNMMLFFIEADIYNGEKNYRGIHVYHDDEVYDVLENGRVVTASADSSPHVFLGADDGLYIYDSETMTASKYGDFDYSIKDIAKENNNDVIYILTDDNEVYKVYDDGTQKERIDELEGAQQLMMDYENNLYYYGADKQPYVRREDGEIIKIERLPEAREVRLLRPMLTNDGVEFLADNELYTIYPNGNSEPDYYEFQDDAKPTALNMEIILFKYFGHDKMIYELSVFPEVDDNDDDENDDENESNDNESDDRSQSDNDDKNDDDENDDDHENGDNEKDDDHEKGDNNENDIDYLY